MNFPENLSKKLDDRKKTKSLRVLVAKENFQTDFYSNDYLGFAKDESIATRAQELLKNTAYKNGSGAARLIAGNHPLHQQLENVLTQFHNAPAALLFNSGYDANVGLFSAIGERHSIVLYDALIHASIRDGIRMGNARAYPFLHNDLNDLIKKLERFPSGVFVAVEGVYSMDGDEAPLEKICEICKKYGAYLIVDEAHSGGIFGKNGVGLVQKLTLQKQIFARVHTFEKHWGRTERWFWVVQKLISYLVNFARSFIYTTAMPPHHIATLIAAYEKLADTTAFKNLTKNITFFKRHIFKEDLQNYFIKSNSPIQCFLSGRDTLVKIAAPLEKQGVGVKIILHPTVPKGAERLRICLHSYNSEKEILNLFVTICKVIRLN